MDEGESSDGLTGRGLYKAILLSDRLQAEVVAQPRLFDKVVDSGHFGHEVAEIRLMPGRQVACLPTLRQVRPIGIAVPMAVMVSTHQGVTVFIGYCSSC